MWLDWPAALQLDANAPATVALIDQWVIQVPEILAKLGLPNEIIGEVEPADARQVAAQLVLLHAGATVGNAADHRALRAIG